MRRKKHAPKMCKEIEKAGKTAQKHLFATANGRFFDLIRPYC
jgi:hypothetical protein